MSSARVVFPETVKSNGRKPESMGLAAAARAAPQIHTGISPDPEVLEAPAVDCSS